MVVTDAVVVEEIFINSVEHESQDTVRELRFLLATFWVDKLRVELVDDVEFKIEELTVDGMFGWGVEMRLQAKKSAFFDMAIEKTNRCSLHIVVPWSFIISQNNLELFTCLLEFALSFWINVLILKLELFILEVLMNFHISPEVNWSLKITELTNSLLISSFLSKDGPQVDHCFLKEVGTRLLFLNLLQSIVDNLPVDFFVLSWSLIDRVTVVPGVVVVKGVSVILFATWHTSNNWKEFRLSSNI